MSTPITRQNIDRLKAEIKAELSEKFGESFSPAKRAHLASAIQLLQNDMSTISACRQLIYLNHVLIGHARSGHINRRKIDEALKLGRGLTTMLEKTVGETGSTIVRDFHFAKSLIDRRNGDHDAAAWEQAMAAKLPKPVKTGRAPSPIDPSHGYMLLGSAIRLLRLGHAKSALRDFVVVATVANDPPTLYQALIGRCKCLRLLWQIDELQSLVAQHCADKNIDPQVALELKWEALLADAFAKKDPTRLIHAVRHNGTHRQGTYILDALVVWQCLGDGQSRRGLPKLSYLSKRSDIEFAADSGFFMAALAIEKLGDKEIPLEIRLTELGEAFAARSNIISVDQELLFLAAASYKLQKLRQPALFELTLLAYRSLSLVLTEGVAQDALHLDRAEYPK